MKFPRLCRHTSHFGSCSCRLICELHAVLRKRWSRKDLPVQIQTSALELFVLVSSVDSGEKQVLLGCDSSHPRLCPSNHLAAQMVRNNVVKISSEQDSFMPGLNIPYFLHKLRACSQLAENYIMFIWPMHSPLQNNSLITIVIGFHWVNSVVFFLVLIEQRKKIHTG